MPRKKPTASGLSATAKRELAEYQRAYQARRKDKLYSTTPPKDNLLARQTYEKLTALFHKVHNLQVEVAAALAASAETNRLLLRILERPEDRVDAAEELAKQRAARIERYTE